MRRTSARQARLNQLWGAACAFAGIFFLAWAVSFVKANVLNEGLRSHCEAFHSTRFPFENSCTRGDGTVEGANGLLFETVFFGSMAAAAACLTAAFAVEATRRR
ncbi:hypothetical protein G3M58_64045 [Streptomyces sp. SID7499]|uniref:Uncharacterized protein n=1 Tax=Streptomyces sp. SID7499 TaxID=2706086 RepID=A0A6G3XIH0_9ACTN|nr:hypothetical protein [Streptomyces sp. SID7499]